MVLNIEQARCVAECRGKENDISPNVYTNFAILYGQPKSGKTRVLLTVAKDQRPPLYRLVFNLYSEYTERTLVLVPNELIGRQWTHECELLELDSYTYYTEGPIDHDITIMTYETYKRSNRPLYWARVIYDEPYIVNDFELVINANFKWIITNRYKHYADENKKNPILNGILSNPNYDQFKVTLRYKQMGKFKTFVFREPMVCIPPEVDVLEIKDRLKLLKLKAIDKDAMNSILTRRSISDELHKSIMNAPLTCPVCLDESEYTILTTCNHILCGSCLYKIYTSTDNNISCPICRQTQSLGGLYYLSETTDLGFIYTTIENIINGSNGSILIYYPELTQTEAFNILATNRQELDVPDISRANTKIFVINDLNMLSGINYNNIDNLVVSYHIPNKDLIFLKSTLNNQSVKINKLQSVYKRRYIIRL